MQQKAEAELREAGLEVTSIINGDDPRRVMVEEAEHWEADSIFVGTSGKGRVGRWLLGSVSAAVVARAHCSVEVVRPRETA
jgi:nucleotide-binding universal stress UspA family protein